MPNQYTKFKTAIQNSEHCEFRWREWDVSKRQKRPKTGQRKRPSKTAKDADSYLRDEDSVDDTIAHLEQIARSNASLVQYLPSGGLRIDPFRAFPVNPDRSELTVLDYFLHILAPSGKHNQQVLRSKSMKHVDPHIRLLLPYVMHEAPLFNALLATCQASIALSSGLSAYSDPFLMSHRGRAMAGLRKQLETGFDVSALLAVSMLLTCDYLTGDIKAVAGHFTALQRMVRMRGELPEATAWDKFVKRGVRAYSLMGYLATGIRLETDTTRHELDFKVDPFQRLEYPQPPFSVELCEQWSRLPHGFCELILASQVSTQLIAVISTLHETRNDEVDDLIGSLGLVQPVQAALQRFSQHPDATYIERCIAAGLLAYSFQHPYLQTPNLFHDPPMLGFIRLLSISYRPQSTCERDLMVWAHIAVEGFLAARSSRLPGGTDLFAKAKIRYNLMKDWNTVSAILRRFFWTDVILERWKVCYHAHSTAVTIKESGSALTSPRQQGTFGLPVIPDKTLSKCPFSGQWATSDVGGTALCPFRSDDEN